MRIIHFFMLMHTKLIQLRMTCNDETMPYTILSYSRQDCFLLAATGRFVYSNRLKHNREIKNNFRFFFFEPRLYFLS